MGLDIHGTPDNRNVHGNATDRDIHGNRPRDVWGNEWDRPSIGAPSFGGGGDGPASGGGTGGLLGGGRSNAGRGDGMGGLLLVLVVVCLVVGLSLQGLMLAATGMGRVNAQLGLAGATAYVFWLPIFGGIAYLIPRVTGIALKVFAGMLAIAGVFQGCVAMTASIPTWSIVGPLVYAGIAAVLGIWLTRVARTPERVRRQAILGLLSGLRARRAR